MLFEVSTIFPILMKSLEEICYLRIMVLAQRGS